MKKISVLVLALAVCIGSLAGCGSSDGGSGGSQNNKFPIGEPGSEEQITPEVESEKLSASDAGFELHDGFIKPVEQQTEVPSGYIGVYTYEDLRQIADSCPSDSHMTSRDPLKTEFNTAKYILMNDIEMASDHDSAAIFYGVIDGNGYTIRNLNRPLFLHIADATIVNLGMEIHHQIDTEDNEYIFGTVAGYVDGFFNDEGVVIDNCFVKGTVDITCRSGEFGGFLGNAADEADGEDAVITNCYSEADITVNTRQNGFAGGITGRSGNISNCFNAGDISIHTTGENTMNVESCEAMAAGIVGYLSQWDLINCYNTGDISVLTDRGMKGYAGGLVAYYYHVGNHVVDFKNCYNTGNISCDWNEEYDISKEYGDVFTPGYSAGGIVGYSWEGLRISNCWNGGDITGEHFTGGIAGVINDDTDHSEWRNITDSYNLGSISSVQYAGGILGYDNDVASMERCYHMGTINDALYSGALAGFINSGEECILDCYILDGEIGATATGIEYTGVTKVNEEDFGKKKTFTSFDFENVWCMRKGEDYPTLRMKTVESE